MNITFKADISAHVETRPSVLYWVIQPGSDVGGTLDRRQLAFEAPKRKPFHRPG